MKRLVVLMLTMFLLLTAVAVQAEGEEKYLHLQKTQAPDTTITYNMLKSTQDYAGAYDSIEIQSQINIDQADGFDGIEIFRSGSWTSYAYLRQDGTSGLKVVVKGSNASSESGEPIANDTEFKGLKYDEWYSYSVKMTLKEPYTTTMTLKDKGGAVVFKAVWQDIAERNNFGMVLRPNTKVSIKIKKLKVLGSKDGADSVIEDRNYAANPEGNYYGGTTDGIGGVDNVTRTSKLYVLEDEIPEVEKFLTVKRSEAGGDAASVTYNAVKGVNGYASTYDSIVLRTKLKIEDIAGVSGVTIWGYGYNIGGITPDGTDGWSFDCKNAAGDAIVKNGLHTGEWYDVAISVMASDAGQASISIKDQTGQSLVAEELPSKTGVGVIAFEIKANSKAAVSFRDITVVGVKGGTETEIEKRNFLKSAAGAYNGGAGDGLSGLGGLNSAYLTAVTEAQIKCRFDPAMGSVMLNSAEIANDRVTAVTFGGNLLVTAVPSAGYEVEGISLNGVSGILSGNEAEFSNITEDGLVTVTFKEMTVTSPDITSNPAYNYFRVQDGKATIYVYGKLSDFNLPGAAPEYGMKLWAGDDTANTLTLPAWNPDTDAPAAAAPGTAFAIRVYGNAITTDQVYRFVPYVGGTEGSVITMSYSEP